MIRLLLVALLLIIIQDGLVYGSSSLRISSNHPPSHLVRVPFLLRLRGGGGGEEEADDSTKKVQLQQQQCMHQDDFEILEDKVVYNGWRTITQRTVRMRNGKIVTFDVSLFVMFGWLYVY